jgi:hypothetical protein
MTALPNVQSHPASVDAYIRHGWSLVPIPPGTKGPRTPGWNLKPNALKTQGDLPQGYGIGLAHAYSGTMAFDIDDWGITVAQGIDLDALYAAPDAVIVNSGRPGHGKLLYQMPFGLALPSKKIIVDGVTAYELRCATANGLTVQDVLPPSIHPDTKQPYTWAGDGNWMRLPTIPQQLLDIWQSLLEFDKVRNIGIEGNVDASWEEIQQALEFISPDCPREDWINVGMALHWAGTQLDELDQALALWNDWSMPSGKYPGEREIVKQWMSFKTGHSGEAGHLVSHCPQGRLGPSYTGRQRVVQDGRAGTHAADGHHAEPAACAAGNGPVFVARGASDPGAGGQRFGGVRPFGPFVRWLGRCLRGH